MKKFCKEYLALQNFKKKYSICAWKLSLNKGNYALKSLVKIIQPCKIQKKTDRQTDKVSYRGALLLKIVTHVGILKASQVGCSAPRRRRRC